MLQLEEEGGNIEDKKLTYNNKIILAVVSLTGCKTEYIYLTVFPVKGVTEITDTIYVASDNRFKMDFQKADSIFSVIEKASDDAMKSAILKFKR